MIRPIAVRPPYLHSITREVCGPESEHSWAPNGDSVELVLVEVSEKRKAGGSED